MEREQISLVRCEDYRPDAVKEAVARAIDLAGGPGLLASPGERVFIKSNCVIAAEPSSGIVTNPEVVKAVIEQVKEVTDDIVIGDCPGGPFKQTFLKRVYEKTGIADVARATGVELALDTRTAEVQLPEGRALKRITLCASMLEADRLISVSKFKSHRYLNVTGPVKNLYGAVPGTTKFVYHSRFEDDREFADLVVDVHLAAAPDFHVLDAVEVLEGNGARNGTKRPMRAIAAGSNAFALESLVLELAGLTAADDRTLEAAVRRGICPEGIGWLDIRGEEIGSMRSPGFELPERNFFSERVPALITGRLARFTAVTPLPMADRCNRCGKCAEICPRQAITIGPAMALIDTRKCIRCFCCDELCEQLAIEMHTPLLARLFQR